MGKQLAIENKSDEKHIESSVKPNSRSACETIEAFMKVIDINRSTRTFMRSQERQILREFMETIGEQHQLISGSPKLFKEFIAHPFWKPNDAHRPKLGQEAETGRFLLLYLCGDNKKASHYWSAIGPLLASGVNPEDLPKAILKAGGFRKLAARNGKKSGKTGAESDASEDDDVAAQSNGGNVDSDEAPDVATGPRVAGAEPDAKTAKSLPDKAMAAAIKRVSEKFLLIPIDDDNVAIFNEADGAVLNALISIAKIEADGFLHLKLDVNRQGN